MIIAEGEKFGEELSSAVHGKTIDSISVEDEYETRLVFAFTDGTFLKIRYDWLYDWESHVSNRRNQNGT